jgi:Glycosyltransferase family 87
VKILPRLPLWTALWIAAVGLTAPRLAERSLQAASIARRSSEYDFRVDTLLFEAPIRVVSFDTVKAGAAIALLLATVLIIGEIGRRAFSCARDVSISVLVALQGLAGVVLAFSQVTFSPDPTAYILYARLYGVFGVNPYRAPPALPPHDQILSTVAAFWSLPPVPANVYGPLWTIFAGAIAHLQAEMPLSGQWVTQRLIAAAASMAAAAGLFRIMRRCTDQRDAQARVATFAFHPLVLLETAIDGHNDMVMVACAMWAFALLEDLPLAAGALLGASIAVKYLSIIAVPFFLVALWHAHEQRIRAASAAIFGICAVPLASFAPFWFGLRTLQPIISTQSDVSDSPAALLADIYLTLAGKAQTDPVFAGQSHWHVFRHASAGIFVDLAFIGAWMLLAAISAYRFARTRNLRLPYLAGTSFFAAIPALPPYYLIWLSPLLVERSRWGRYVWFLLAIALVYYAQCLMGNLDKQKAGDVYALALLLVPLGARFIERGSSKGR